eukprot:s1490_g20.t2
MGVRILPSRENPERRRGPGRHVWRDDAAGDSPCIVETLSSWTEANPCTESLSHVESIKGGSLHGDDAGKLAAGCVRISELPRQAARLVKLELRLAIQHLCSRCQSIELHGDFERLADVDVGNWGFRRLNVRLISA